MLYTLPQKLESPPRWLWGSDDNINGPDQGHISLMFNVQRLQRFATELI